MACEILSAISEVAELTVDCIRRDNFWATVPMDEQNAKLRARTKSQIDQTPPDYLLAPNLMAKSAAERDGE